MLRALVVMSLSNVAGVSVDERRKVHVLQECQRSDGDGRDARAGSLAAARTQSRVRRLPSRPRVLSQVRI